MSSLRWALVLCLLAAGSVGLAAAPKVDPWPVYTNARYGYQLEHAPDALLEEEAQNGDGRRILSADKALEVLVWGDLDPMLGGVDGRWAELLAPADGAKITYKRRGKDFLVVSGTVIKDGVKTVFYRKVLTGRPDQFATFEARYPFARKRDLDKVVARMALSMRYASAE